MNRNYWLSQTETTAFHKLFVPHISKFGAPEFQNPMVGISASSFAFDNPNFKLSILMDFTPQSTKKCS